MSMYEKIFFSFHENIKKGIYPPGSRLPSIRETAEQYGCNKITAQKAFERLKAEGLIENHVGRGSFVTYPRHSDPQQHGLYPFHSAYISEELFPMKEAGRIFEELFRTDGHLFDAGPMGGDPQLVQVLSGRYRVNPDSTFIISGAQQGLNLCSTLYNLDVSEHIVFEDPTYSGAISVFRPKHFVPLLEDGPDLEVLKRMVREKVRFFYVIPQVHNPTGITYSEQKMATITEYADAYDFFLIEDDYLSEFHDGPVQRFVDRAPHRTIYIKSLSKVTAPGIRLGFMSVPPELYREFIYGKYSADLGTSLLMQKFFTRFISSGLMDSHLERCRKLLKDRKKALGGIIGKYSFLRVHPGQSGYNIWVESEIPLPVPNPPWAKGENFSFSSRVKNSFRLSLLGMNDGDFENGIMYLDSLFRAYSQSETRPVY